MIVHVKDALNLLSRLTFRRATNLARVITGYYVSRITGRPRVFGLPFSVSVEPTTSCNLRCPECPSGLRSFTRPTGMLQTELFRKITDELYRDITYMIFYFQGEPFLNRNLLEMIRHASSKKIYTATSTNAHFLDDDTARQTVESGLDRLIISIDGATDEVYRQYRVGGSLSKVLEGAGNVIKWKRQLRSSTPYIVFQFLVVRPNEHQVEDARKMASEKGIDRIVFKTAQIYDYKNGNELIPNAQKYSRYRKSGDTYVIRNKLLNHCWRLWHSSVVTWDGQVLPCCYDKDASHNVGNVSAQTFREIWKGKQYNSFRKSVLNARKQIDICTNCTEGTHVFN